MTLEYWKEYSAYFYIGLTYGISEANCYRNIRSIEDILIKRSDFQLPEEKELLKHSLKQKLLLLIKRCNCIDKLPNIQ